MLNFNDLKITHSTILSKGGKPFVAVMFERGKDRAEGGIPECKITNNEGFSSGEVEELEDFLHEHKPEIIDAARGISSLTHLLG